MKKLQGVSVRFSEGTQDDENDGALKKADACVICLPGTYAGTVKRISAFVLCEVKSLICASEHRVPAGLANWLCGL